MTDKRKLRLEKDENFTFEKTFEIAVQSEMTMKELLIVI